MKMIRPFGITLVSLAYFLSPFGNLVQAAFFAHKGIGTVIEHSVRGFGALGAVLILVAPLVGIGIYSGRRWGFVLFLIHAALLLGSNAVMLANGKHAHVAVIIAVDVAVFFAVAFIMQRDMRAPYLDAFPRGWRLKKRVPCQLVALVRAGDRTIEGTTINLSRTGVLVACVAEAIAPEASVTVTLKSPSGSDLVRSARVIRVDKATLALAFVGGDASADARVIEILQQVTG